MDEQHAVQPAERVLRTETAVMRGSGRAKAVAAFAVLAVVVTSTVTAWAMSSPGDDDRAVLVRNGDSSISLLDPGTGTTRFDLDDAYPTPDLSTLLTTRSHGSDTVLQSRDATTGAVTGSTTLDGTLHVRSVSPRGGAVVLMPGARSPNLYEPEPRTTTELTVAFLDDRPAKRFRLDGNLEPEMLSVDETTLFVLDFEPPTAPTSYSVRKLDLDSGEVTDTHSSQVDVNPKMAGHARAQALHPDGTFLYTLYTLPADQPIHDIEVDEGAERFAFVHVISLEEKWSHCIFLPVPFGTTDEATIGMAVAPGGDTVLVGDPAVGEIAVIDTGRLEVSAVHDVPQLRDTGERAILAVGRNGTVYASSGQAVLELDRHTFDVVWAWWSEDVVTGLSVTDSELRVAAGGAVTLLDRGTRSETGVIGGSGRGTVDLLGPPQGAVVEFPLECAC